MAIESALDFRLIARRSHARRSSAERGIRNPDGHDNNSVLVTIAFHRYICLVRDVDFGTATTIDCTSSIPRSSGEEESAGGVDTGVVVLMMQRRTFVPTSKNFVVPNPEIDLDSRSGQRPARRRKGHLWTLRLGARAPGDGRHGQMATTGGRTTEASAAASVPAGGLRSHSRIGQCRVRIVSGIRRRAGYHAMSRTIECERNRLRFARKDAQ